MAFEIGCINKGCGNSSLSQDMHDDGYHSITNVDYSQVVIDNMQRKSPSMRWIVEDIKDLNFPPASFDVVIEKATIDALLVNERDPWRLSDDACRMTERILDKVVLFYLSPFFFFYLYTNGWICTENSQGAFC